MARSKQQKKAEPESEEISEEEEDLDNEEFDGFDDQEDDYVTKAQLKEELKSRIGQVEGEKKVAFAAMFELFGKQEDIDLEEEKEIQAIKHKYRLRSEELINKVRKIVAGESTENGILASSEILNEEQKKKSLKDLSVPDFWSTFVKNSSLGAFIDKSEVPAIDAITNIVAKANSEANEVSIEIHFGENTLFTDSVLKATLTENEEGEIKHTHDTPKYKPHFVKAEEGFFNVFDDVSQEVLPGLFECWLSLYQQELPQALAFYFELRDPSFHGKTAQFHDQDYDDVDEEGKAISKKKIEKPQCNQQ